MASFHLFLALLLTTLAPAEVLTLLTGNRPPNSAQPIFSSTTITLAEGDLATARYLSNNALVDVMIGRILVRIDANDPNQSNLPVIAGPATVRLANFSTLNAALATFTITRSGAPTPVPAQVVVIPDDGSGDHQVHLESSTDMVSWTATQPGLFNSSNATRFFRVRVARTVSP